MKFRFRDWSFGVTLSVVCVAVACVAKVDEHADPSGDGGAGGEAGGSGQGQTGGQGYGGGAGGETNGGGGSGAVTPDAGAATGGAAGEPAGDAAVDDDKPPPGYVPSIVAVGYGGLRVLSKDGGRTWGDRSALASGNNEGTLLRTVTYGAGRYVAVGNAGIFASTDGANWTRFLPNIGFLQGISYGNKLWVGGGGCGATVRSADGGQTWQQGPTITKQLPSGNCVHIRSVAFANGLFYASDDGNVIHTTPDGLVWSIDPKLSYYQIAFCGGAFKERAGCRPQGIGGIFIQPNGYRLERSNDGKVWQSVYTDTGKNEFFWPCNPIAFGYSPP